MALKVAGLTETTSPRALLIREAKWLMSRYEDVKWIIVDTIGEGEPQEIDFHVMLPNGIYLTENEELYKTVKEFIWWIRQGKYTRIDDAARHKQYALAIIQIAWGLVARGFSSFAELTEEDIREICAASAKGRDGITNASILLQGMLNGYSTWSEVPAEYKKDNLLDLTRLAEALHVPIGWARRPLHQEVAAATARLNGKTFLRAGPKQITVQNVSLVTTTFEALFQLRHFMHASSVTVVCEEGAYALAKSLGAATDPTPIAPPELVLRFIGASADYIVRHSRQVTAKYLAVWSSRDTEGWNPKVASEAKSEVKWIAAAAFLLIAAFTARRLDEIYMLRRDCLKGTDEHGWWLTVYIEKLREWTSIPVPRIVARVVETLKAFDLSEPGDDQRLFRLNDPVSGKKIKLLHNMNGLAAKLGANTCVNRGGVEQQWIWTPRQFRRFFAVLYIYRWFGKKETLAHHLRHRDLETANDYLVLDPEVSDIWLKEIADYRTFIAERVVAKDKAFIGPMGDRLQKYIQRVRRTLDQSVMIVSEEKAEVILRLMKKLHLVVTVKPWATCCCPNTQGGCERAACRKDVGFRPGETGPDFIAAGPSICPGCPWALISEGNEDYIGQELEELTESVAQVSGAFADLASEKIVVLSQYRESLREQRLN
ncbi:hypothetical protein [Rhizobium lentis]|uniref:hypothetical protein n=1 Tax=Rhizobium lentis TaxID=1138194 RepID=UPI001C83FB8C|nr:hypothetical protein [Rhizobium lentis]MBX5014950.1 hypothetical protein [Rhizobium lentis]